MALDDKQRLRLVAASKTKKSVETERVEELTALVNKVVMSNLIPGKDGTEGPQGIQGERGEKGEKGDVGPQGLPGKDGTTEVIHKFEPLPESEVKVSLTYHFEIIRDDFGRITEVIARPNEVHD